MIAKTGLYFKCRVMAIFKKKIISIIWLASSLIRTSNFEIQIPLTDGTLSF